MRPSSTIGVAASSRLSNDADSRVELLLLSADEELATAQLSNPFDDGRPAQLLRLPLMLL